MAIKEQIESLLDKEIDRKNFLMYGVGLILAAIGVTSFFRVLFSSHDVHERASSPPKRLGAIVLLTICRGIFYIIRL